MYSDQRLNNNVQDISKAIEKLTMIRGVAFKYLNLVQWSSQFADIANLN